MTSWSPDKCWNEECGVFAVVGVPRASEITALGLHALQHRGQEATGIVSCDERGDFHVRKGIGLVSDVFDSGSLSDLPGQLAIGHNRYSTAGGLTLENTQPLRVVYRGGPLALAHNGNLTNAAAVRQLLARGDCLVRGLVRSAEAKAITQGQADLEVQNLFGPRPDVCEAGAYKFFMDSFELFTKEAMRAKPPSRDKLLRLAIAMARKAPAKVPAAEPVSAPPEITRFGG